jgi:hypothetical protein
MKLNLSSAMNSYLSDNKNQTNLNKLAHDINSDNKNEILDSSYNDKVEINNNELSNSIGNSNKSLTTLNQYEKNYDKLNELLNEIKSRSVELIKGKNEVEEVDYLKNEIIKNIDLFDEYSSKFPTQTIIFNTDIENKKTISLTLENFDSTKIGFDSIYTLNNFKNGFEFNQNTDIETKTIKLDIQLDDRIEEKTIKIPLQGIQKKNIEQQASILLAMINNTISSIKNNKDKVLDTTLELETLTRKILNLRSNIKMPNSDIDYEQEVSLFSKSNILSRAGSFISSQINNIDKNKVQQLIA